MGQRWARYCLTNSTTEEPLNREEVDAEAPLDGLVDAEAVDVDGARDDFFQNLTHPSTLVVMTKLERGVTVTELIVSRCMRDLK